MSYSNRYNISPPRRQGTGGPYFSDPNQHDNSYYNDNSDIYSQYSQPSFVSNNNNNVGGGGGAGGYGGAGGGGGMGGRTITPMTQQPPSSYSYNAPTHTAPGVGDYFPPTQIQPRPSFSSSHHPYGGGGGQDFPDETKSYASTSHLNKEWGVGDVVPPVPQQPYAGYPPRMAQTHLPPQTPGGTAHWHQVRNQLLERRVVKQVPLINGNLVMDVPVAKGCIPSQSGLGTMPDEMEKLRYSAATCDPDEFMRKKFSLRPYLYGRKTELFVRSSLFPSPPPCSPPVSQLSVPLNFRQADKLTPRHRSS